MSRINCSVDNCSHNNEHICFANIINVGGKSAKKDSDTCCASFLDLSAYSGLTNNVNDKGSECDAINCNVGTCHFNDEHACTAKNIEVNGENVNLYAETDCQTFKPAQ